MKLLSLRPCWGVVFTIGKPSSRNGVRMENGVSRPIRSVFLSYGVQKNIRHFLLLPITDGHGTKYTGGRQVGFIAWARIRDGALCVYGFCEKRILVSRPVVSIGTIHNVSKEIAGIEIVEDFYPDHLAVYTDRLGAFDTFLKAVSIG